MSIDYDRIHKQKAEKCESNSSVRWYLHTDWPHSSENPACLDESQSRLASVIRRALSRPLLNRAARRDRPKTNDVRFLLHLT